VHGGEGLLGVDAVGNDAEHVIWSGFDVWKELFVDFFDHAHAILKEQYRGLSREAVFDRCKRRDCVWRLDREDEVINDTAFVRSFRRCLRFW